MAVQTPPFVLQNSSHGSELVRREALASLPFGSAGGVVPATPAASANLTAGVAGCSDLKVSAPASGMSCLLNSGQVYVPGTLGSGSGYGIGTGYGMPTVTLNGAAAPTVASNAKATAVQLTTQGIYYCYNDNSAGQVSLTVAASNATNPRIDVVIAQVEDASYSGSNNDWKLAVVTGTAAASPTVPTLPANAVVLAYLWIPAASTSVTAGNILDLRYACNRNPFNMRAHRSAAWTTLNGTNTFGYDVIDYDLVGSTYNSGSGTYTAPVSGLYRVELFLGAVSSAANQSFLTLTNGPLWGAYSNSSAGSQNMYSLLVGTIPLSQGATFVTQYNCNAAGLTGSNSTVNAYLACSLATPL